MMIKKKEGWDYIKKFNPSKNKDEDDQQDNPKNKLKLELPKNGREFFFSNVLMKVY